MTCDRQEMARLLWRRLAPERWPVPAEAFPAGTALVGGAVRDGLLDRLGERPDLDLVVEGDAIALTRRLARGHHGSCVVLDGERSIARLVVRGWTIDLARRAGDDLATDLARRDYGVNAIALPLAGADRSLGLEDPQGGLADLAAGRLRAIGEANLLDDPLRLLRGLRLAAELGFEVEAETVTWIRQHAARCGSVAGERVLAELERLAAVAQGGEFWLGRAVDWALLAPWGAPTPAPPALGGLTAEAAELRGLSPQEAAWALPLARLATVLDGAALAGLRASRRLQQRSIQLRRHWALVDAGEKEAGEREGGAADAGGGGADPLTRLAEPDRLTLQRQLEADLPAWLLRLPVASARVALQRWRNPDDPLFHPRPPLDGRTLQEALGLGAGPELGRLIDHLTREQAFGRLSRGEGSDAKTLTCARQWLAERDGRHG